MILQGHLKCGSNNTSNRMDRAVPSPILLHLDEPCLGIRLLHPVNTHLTEIFLFEDVQNKVVIRLHVMADIDFQGQVLLHQFQHSEVSAVGNDLIEQILLDLPFLFPQGQIPYFASRRPVIFVQPPTVNEFYIAIQVFVLVGIPAVWALALSNV